MERYIPERILLAREARGYTQKSLADAIGVTQGVLSKLENGRYPASCDLINDVAAELLYPVSFFKLPFRLQQLPSSFYRKRKNISARLTKRIEANTNILLEHLEVFLQSIELPEFDLPPLNLNDFNGSPEEAARYLRLELGAGRGPIRNMTNLLEAHGIIVVPFDFESRLFDGLSIRPDGPLPAVVLAAIGNPGCRLRFSLAHELGHLVMHNSFISPDRDIEDEADRFAAEFLMPENEIKPFLRGITLQRLAQLKEHWKTSMASLLFRAKYLDCIGPDREKYYWKRFNKLGYRTQEPIVIPREENVLFDSIIQIHLNELNYSQVELSQVLHFDLGEFQRWYGLSEHYGQQPMLKVVT